MELTLAQLYMEEEEILRLDSSSVTYGGRRTSSSSS